MDETRRITSPPHGVTTPHVPVRLPAEASGGFERIQPWQLEALAGSLTAEGSKGWVALVGSVGRDELPLRGNLSKQSQERLCRVIFPFRCGLRTGIRRYYIN